MSVLGGVSSVVEYVPSDLYYHSKHQILCENIFQLYFKRGRRLVSFLSDEYHGPGATCENWARFEVKLAINY